MNRHYRLGIAFFFGVLAGGLIFGHAKHRPAPLPPTTIVFEPGEELTITRAQHPGQSYRLVPFSVKRGAALTTFGTGPGNADDLWLISTGDTVLACRVSPPGP